MKLIFALLSIGILFLCAASLTVRPHGQPAYKSKGLNNGTQIAKAYMTYEFSGRRMKTITSKDAKTVHDVAYLLASKVKLNDASLYILEQDPQVLHHDGELPKKILSKSKPNPKFANTPISFTLTIDRPLNAPTSTTPLLWTRGLQADGTWTKDSPYQGDGGHIVFSDGHGTYFKSGTVELWKYGTKEKTYNIHEALPPGVTVLEYPPTDYPDKDYSLSWAEYEKELEAKKQWDIFLNNLPLYFLIIAILSINCYISWKTKDLAYLLLIILSTIILAGIFIPATS